MVSSQTCVSQLWRASSYQNLSR